MTGKQKQPFARRIVTAFTLMVLVVSGTLSLGIFGAVHFVEEKLVSQELDREMNSVLYEDLKHGKPLRLDPDTRFFASDRNEYAIPAHFKDVQEGFSEAWENDRAYYVYARNSNGERYMLVQDQHEFEARERALFTIVFMGFVLTVAGAWLIGLLTAKKVMAPISRLAQQVRHRDQLLSFAPPMAPDYANDEIGRLAEAFDATLGQLRLSLERERLFTSDVSHELRTPLMVIASSCELLENAGLKERECDQLNRITRAAEEMRDLVETFLMLARAIPEDSAFEHNANLATVAEEQSQHWKAKIADKGIRYELIVEAQDPDRYNASFLRTVMGNLLRNALHYTDRGVIRLVLEEGGFRVEDTGIGISAQEKEDIFQPFIRGSQTRGEGLGLGLSLVRRICVRQQWAITVGNLPEGGSCFRVRFY